MNSLMIFERSLGNRRSGGSLWGRAAALVLIASWVFLRPLAAASPPDPTWISGMYDDADFDDVIIHIGLLASVSGGWGPPALAPDSHVRPVALPGPPAIVSTSRLTIQDRSPPLI